MIVRVNPLVAAELFSQELRRAVREDLVRIHVVRLTGASLIHVDHELAAQLAGEDLIRSGNDGSGKSWLEPSERFVGFGRSLFYENRRRDECRRRREAADREVLDGAGGLAAEIGADGDADVADRVMFDAEFPHRLSIEGSAPPAHGDGTVRYTSGMLPAFFDSVVDLITRT